MNPFAIMAQWLERILSALENLFGQAPLVRVWFKAIALGVTESETFDIRNPLYGAFWYACQVETNGSTSINVELWNPASRGWHWQSGDPNPLFTLSQIQNGDFTTDYSSWTLFDASASILTNQLLLANADAISGRAEQEVTVTAGRSYRLKWKHKNGTMTGRVKIGTTSGGSEIYDSGTLNDATEAGYEVSFVPAVATIYVSLWVNDASPLNDTLFDEVRLVNVRAGFLAAPFSPGLKRFRFVAYNAPEITLGIQHTPK